jgi:hypothetical protein
MLEKGNNETDQLPQSGDVIKKLREDAELLKRLLELQSLKAARPFRPGDSPTDQPPAS